MQKIRLFHKNSILMTNMSVNVPNYKNVEKLGNFLTSKIGTCPLN